MANTQRMMSSASRKRVRFTTASPVVHSAVPLLFDDDFQHDDVWWQPDDFKTFKANNQRMVETAVKIGDAMARLDSINKRASQIAAKTFDTKKLGQLLQKLPVEEHAIFWCGNSNLRGLERQMQKHHDATTSTESHLAYHNAIVLWEQHTVSSPEELRMVSQYMSRPCRVVARMLGQADALLLSSSSSSSSSASWPSSNPWKSCRLDGRMGKLPMVRQSASRPRHVISKQA